MRSSQLGPSVPFNTGWRVSDFPLNLAVLNHDWLHSKLHHVHFRRPTAFKPNVVRGFGNLTTCREFSGALQREGSALTQLHCKWCALRDLEVGRLSWRPSGARCSCVISNFSHPFSFWETPLPCFSHGLMKISSIPQFGNLTLFSRTRVFSVDIHDNRKPSHLSAFHLSVVFKNLASDVKQVSLFLAPQAMNRCLALSS